MLSCFGALLCCGAAFGALGAGRVGEECSAAAGRSLDGLEAVLLFAGRFAAGRSAVFACVAVLGRSAVAALLLLAGRSAVFVCVAVLGRSAAVALLLLAGRFALFTCAALFVVALAGRFALVVVVCVCALGGRSERVVLERLLLAVFGRFVAAVFA